MADTVDRATLKQVLVPVVAAAVVILLIAVLVTQSNFGPKKSTPSDPTNGAAPLASTVVDGSDTGMTNSVPDPDAAEWIDLGDGLKMWDVQEGEGPGCPRGASVKIHYTGWLTNGSVFDSSRKRGAPADFSLTSLIPGWQQGIPGMKAGGIRRLKIPPALGYGDRGQNAIPGGSTLIFEIKMIGFKS